MGTMETIDWVEHIRLRSEWYAEEGIYTLLKDLIDISVDEYQRGFGKELTIDIKDTCVIIRDNGRGLPLDAVVSATSGSHVGMCNGDLGDVYKMNPFKVANALSAEYDISSYRDGFCSWAKYTKGILQDYGLERSDEKNGSLIRFVPDSELFPNNIFSLVNVEAIVRNVAHQNKGMAISVNGTTFKESF